MKMNKIREKYSKGDNFTIEEKCLLVHQLEGNPHHTYCLHFQEEKEPENKNEVCQCG